MNSRQLFEYGGDFNEEHPELPTVFDDGPEDTGILDRFGNPIYRVRRIGFVLNE